jgi:hypothetical protein
LKIQKEKERESNTIFNTLSLHHDRVVGDERVVAIDFTGSRDYAKEGGVSR